eukprot:11218705-Lingulodinium_polyedra.AAC.1
MHLALVRAPGRRKAAARVAGQSACHPWASSDPWAPTPFANHPQIQRKHPPWQCCRSPTRN